MISKNTIYQLIDYILLNAYSVNSTGLYNGKAGLSLCLFETSRCLGDSYIEEQAFNLLQEALLNKNQDIGFENGLSGIGYVLVYLIRHKFVEADFYELFEEHLKKIMEQLSLLEEFTTREKTFHYNKVIYFLHEMSFFSMNRQFKHYVNFFITESALFLEEKLLMIKNNKANYSKIDLIGSIADYLSILDNCKYYVPSLKLLELYAELYEKSIFISDYTVGYHLGNIAFTLKDNRLYELAEKNKKLSLQNLCVNTMSLSQQIDMLCLLEKEDNKNLSFINTLKYELMEENETKPFEKEILLKICNRNFVPGYQSGIARFLLYWAHSFSNTIINHSFL